MSRIRLAIYLGADAHKLGPGKIRLLEEIRERGSISAAARAMGMAYRHAWELVDDLNRCFATPVVASAVGGREGGGARLTPSPVRQIPRRRWVEPCRDEEEAIRIANDTPYGLAGYVSSKSLERARRVACRLRAGQINVNGAPPDFTAPFGGCKQSGNGREWGVFGFEEFLEVKAITGWGS